MNAAAPGSVTASENALAHHESWSRARWAFYLALAFATHVGLIFLFGSRKPTVPRAVVNAPEIQFTTGRSELLTLDDPTLFALPHSRGFAAAAWQQLPRIEFLPFRWTEPGRLFSLPMAKLGSTFLRFAHTNAVLRPDLEILSPPATTTLEASGPPTSLRQQSRVTAKGNLAKRPWLNPPAILTSWPASDLLTNSVVRVVVDADGQVFSPVLLPPGSGSRMADQDALEIARTARFAPQAGSGTQQMTGFLVFQWHTVPMPDTNAPPGKP